MLLSLMTQLSYSMQRKRGPRNKHSNDATVWEKFDLQFHEPRTIPIGKHTAIFIHAAVGIFKKKRIVNETLCLKEELLTKKPCKTWGYGNEILKGV